MAAMAAIGVLKVPSSSASSSSTLSNLNKKAISRSLCFSASQLSGDKIATVSVKGGSCGRRNPVIVTPKAVSDSKNSQTCLDPDASRVSYASLLLTWACFNYFCYCSKEM